VTPDEAVAEVGWVAHEARALATERVDEDSELLAGLPQPQARPHGVHRGDAMIWLTILFGAGVVATWWYSRGAS